jgi:2-keto-3-deoxy-galactonokinase
LLIGTEVRHALQHAGRDEEIVVVAEGAIARGYEQALERLGRNCRVLDPEATFLKGLLRLVDAADAA